MVVTRNGGSVAKLGEVLESVESGLVDIGLPCTVFEMAKLEDAYGAKSLYATGDSLLLGFTPSSFDP